MGSDALKCAAHRHTPKLVPQLFQFASNNSVNAPGSTRKTKTNSILKFWQGSNECRSTFVYWYTACTKQIRSELLMYVIIN